MELRETQEERPALEELQETEGRIKTMGKEGSVWPLVSNLEVVFEIALPIV
jgi:hypothetical protein